VQRSCFTPTCGWMGGGGVCVCVVVVVGGGLRPCALQSKHTSCSTPSCSIQHTSRHDDKVRFIFISLVQGCICVDATPLCGWAAGMALYASIGQVKYCSVNRKLGGSVSLMAVPFADCRCAPCCSPSMTKRSGWWCAAMSGELQAMRGCLLSVCFVPKALAWQRVP
jgi:hypothetical protein